MIVSRSNGFDHPSLEASAAAQPPGLGLTVYTWEITDAVVATSASTPGSACPATNKSAVTGSSGHVLVICGRNHADTSLMTLRYAFKGADISVAEKPFETAGRHFGAGTWIVRKRRPKES